MIYINFDPTESVSITQIKTQSSKVFQQLKKTKKPIRITSGTKTIGILLSPEEIGTEENRLKKAKEGVERMTKEIEMEWGGQNSDKDFTKDIDQYTF